jgi:hypothetical protein
VLTKGSCVVAGQLESAITKIKLIGRLQDEAIELSATVEVEQRLALHKLQASAAKARDHEPQKIAGPEGRTAATPMTTDASVQAAMDGTPEWL